MSSDLTKIRLEHLLDGYLALLKPDELKRLQRLHPTNFTHDLMRKYKHVFLFWIFDSIYPKKIHRAISVNLAQVKRTLSTVSEIEGQQIVKQMLAANVYGISDEQIREADWTLAQGMSMMIMRWFLLKPRSINRYLWRK